MFLNFRYIGPLYLAHRQSTRRSKFLPVLSAALIFLASAYNFEHVFARHHRLVPRTLL